MCSDRAVMPLVSTGSIAVAGERRPFARRLLPSVLTTLGLLLGLLLGLAAPATAQQGPPIEKAVKGERCVEDTAIMRRNHMRMLEHQRDETVHGGIRGARHSLKGCVECHAGAKTNSVASAPTDFCASCHVYAAVRIDCFECHASRPAVGSTADRNPISRLLDTVSPVAPGGTIRR